MDSALVPSDAVIDYKAERTLFIGTAGKTNSKHTHRGYTEALNRLEQFAEKEGAYRRFGVLSGTGG